MECLNDVRWTDEKNLDPYCKYEHSHTQNVYRNMQLVFKQMETIKLHIIIVSMFLSWLQLDFKRNGEYRVKLMRFPVYQSHKLIHSTMMRKMATLKLILQLQLQRHTVVRCFALENRLYGSSIAKCSMISIWLASIYIVVKVYLYAANNSQALSIAITRHWKLGQNDKTMRSCNRAQR